MLGILQNRPSWIDGIEMNFSIEKAHPSTCSLRWTSLHVASTSVVQSCPDIFIRVTLLYVLRGEEEQE